MTDQDVRKRKTRRDALRIAALGGLAAATIGLLARSRGGARPAGCDRTGVCGTCPVFGSCRLDAARAARRNRKT